ncbi:MAG: AI-2E family transporter [Candidatus Gracilibacteria bacterium]|nr:AI-2E family transporter [Candidatus Gracilibacteria bacterium]
MFPKKGVLERSENKDFITKLIIIFCFVGILFFVYQIMDILVLLLISLFLNILFSPILNKLNKYKIGDGIGIILIYIFGLIFIFITFFSIVPIFVNQISALINITYDFVNNIINTYNYKGIDGLNLPYFIKNLFINIDLSQILTSIKNNIGHISSFVSDNLKNFLTSGAGIIFSITNVLLNFVLVFIFTFFIALERKDIRSFFYKIIPENLSKYILSKEKTVVHTLSNWFKSQAILGFSIFIITFIGLYIVRIFGVKIDEVLTLAFIAGMMEFVPYVGPFIALLPALAIALGISFKASVIILILYVAIQQIENNILVPYIMGKTLSLSPFSVLIAMTIGASLFGIIGIIISVPIVSIIQIFLSDYLNKR